MTISDSEKEAASYHAERPALGSLPARLVASQRSRHRAATLLITSIAQSNPKPTKAMLLTKKPATSATSRSSSPILPSASCWPGS